MFRFTATLDSTTYVAVLHYQVTEDLTFTRNQIITSEVNISRIYNWDVRRKRSNAASN